MDDEVLRASQFRPSFLRRFNVFSQVMVKRIREIQVRFAGKVSKLLCYQIRLLDVAPLA